MALAAKCASRLEQLPHRIALLFGVSMFVRAAVMTGVQHAEWRQSEAAHGLNSVAFVDVFTLRDDRWLLVLAYGVELQS